MLEELSSGKRNEVLSENYEECALTYAEYHYINQVLEDYLRFNESAKSILKPIIEKNRRAMEIIR